MQPPPRKTFLKSCKLLHSEQYSKLLTKNQQECDLLEDIRNFTKQRSAIERNYGEALCKIASIYQNRKIACVPDIRLEDKSEAWNCYNVWRTVLDETEKLGKARLAAVEVFHQRIAEDAKVVRQNKVYFGKKLSENLQVIQKELQSQIQDLDRTKRSYYDEENVAYDAREKASAAEEKLKRKKGSIFQSIQSMQKNSAKFTAKKEMCDEKSAGARNDYLLSLASSNAHQRRYYEIDFERIKRTMECEMYDKVSEYLDLMSRTELLTCTATQNSYSKIKEQSQTVTRGYNLRCYLTFYPMLGQNIEYEFEPCKGDRLDKIFVHDENAKEQLNSESKRCVSKIQKEIKIIRDANKKIHKLQAANKGDGTEIHGEASSKIEELSQTIRRAETVKGKCEARLEALRDGNIEVEDYSKSLDNDSLGTDLETPVSRSGSTASVKDEVESAGIELDSDAANVPASTTEKEISFDSSELEREEEIVQYQTQQSLEPTGWDPTSVDWGDEPISPLPPVANGPPDDLGYSKCIVLYNYTAQNADELTINENEELFIMAEGDGDGWVQAKNYDGQVGYVPQNYVEVNEEGAERNVEVEVPLEHNEEAADISIEFPSEVPDYSQYIETAEDYSEVGIPPDGPPPELPPPPPAEPQTNFSKSAKLPSLDIPTGEFNSDDCYYCRAMYDYEATCPEELTFEEGQVIHIIKRSVHDVDDGWWEGDIDGEIGLFPSLVVEECRMDGEPFTPDADSISSPCTTPPPHTPPEVPGFLLPPERVIITLPTPEVETAEEAMALRAKQKESGEDESAASEFVPNGECSANEQANSEAISTTDEQTTEANSCGATMVKEAPPVAESKSEPTSAKVSQNDQVIQDAASNSEGLDVATIVITAPTPIKEDAEEAAKAETEIDQEDDGRTDSDYVEGEAIFLEDDRPPPPPPAPEGGGGSNMLPCHEEDDVITTTSQQIKFVPAATAISSVAPRIKTTDSDSLDSNTPTPKSPSPSDGPPDLDPEKLKSLDKIKESIA